MKLPFHIGLSQKEKQLLIRIAIISGSVFLGLVVVAWSILYIRVADPFSSSSQGAKHGLQKNVTYLLPIDIKAHQRVGRHFLARQKPHLAIPHLRRSLYYNPDDHRVRAMLATALLENGMDRKAISQFRTLRETQLNDSLAAIVCARYALALFYADNIEESISRIQECNSRFPDNAEALTYMGQIFASVATDDSSTARDPNGFFEKAIRLEPWDLEARYQQARYFMNQGRYKAARDSLRKLLSINPAYAQAHARLGMIYYYLDQPQMAAQSYKTALTINPHDYNTHYNLGELCYSQGEKKKALTRFKKTLEIKPKHIQANFKTGLIALNNDMYTQAIRYLSHAAEQDPDNIRILLQLAVAHEQQGTPRKALDIYRRITDIDHLNRIALQKIEMLKDALR